MSNIDRVLKKISDKLGCEILSEVSLNQINEPRGNFKNLASFVIRPRTTSEVSFILYTLNQERVGVVPYSGGTGLVAGQIAHKKDFLLLSLDRMNKLREVSLGDGALTVEAGMLLADVKAEAIKLNRVFPLSLASQGSCQIGGNLATNAGGLNVIRYGNARNLCLGLEAVMADGTVFNGLKNLYKDNSGYDLRHLMIGSEGTLAIITAANLKTVPFCEDKFVAMVKVGTPALAVKLLHLFQKDLGECIHAFELISKVGLEFLSRTGFNFNNPFSVSSDWLVLLEISGNKFLDAKDCMENTLSDALNKNIIEDAALAETIGKAASMWSIRENISEANRRIGAISSNDISVPISQIPKFIEVADARILNVSPELQINCFGHLGDGNLHYNIFPPEGKSKKEYKLIKSEIVSIVSETACELGGSFSAEHGIGRLKVADLIRYGDPGKLKIMKSIKNALDPNGILNPGVMFA